MVRTMGKKEKIYAKFLEVSKRTGVPIKKVLDIFWHLTKDGSVENSELLRRVGISKRVLNQVKKALSSYLRPTTRETALRGETVEEVSSLYGSDYLIEEALLSAIEGNTYTQSIKLLVRYKERRPTPRREYDQFTATIETTAKRVSLLNFLGDVKGKRILFLGDDDFTSVPTADLRSAQNIAVVDIDKRILDEIEDISKELNLDIRRLKHDLRKPFPGELKRQFDTVFTDPPYTPEGIKLFVSRAIEALDKRNQTARVYICYGNSDRAKERFLSIQEILCTSGLMIRWVFDKFSRYHGAQSIGSASSLFICETTPQTKPLVRGDYEREIYTNN